MEKYIGSYVQIESDGVKYKGFIKLVDEREKKIVLRKVKNCETGATLRNDCVFYGNQINNLKILENAPEDNVSDEGMSVLKDKNKHILRDASDNGISLFQRQHLQPDRYLAGMNDQSMNHVNSMMEPPDALFIDALNQHFFQAIADISAQKVISFIADGEKVNRFGKIFLVTIGTRDMVYLFDVYKIGAEDFFINGIQKILESADILKVMHDVRMLCDCLKSKYHVLPINIFDTQVANMFIQRNQTGSFPTEVTSLKDCVVEHLNIPAKDCTFDRGKQKIIKNTKNFWHQRPFDKVFRKLCAQAAVFLRELRTVMLEKLLAEFLHGVDLYIKCMSQITDNAVKYINLRKIPEQFRKEFSSQKGKLPRFSLRKNDYSDDGDDDTNRNNERSAWDNGTEFSDKYQKRHGEIIECLDKIEPLIDTSKPLLRSKTQSPADPKLLNTTQNPKVSPNMPESLDKNVYNTPNNTSNDKHNRSPSMSPFSGISTQVEKKKLFPTKTEWSRNTYVDDYQFSTSGSEDSFFLASDEQFQDSDSKQTEGKKKLSDKKTKPRVSDEAKRMIMNHVRRSVPPEGENPNLSSSPASSVETTEFPSLVDLHLKEQNTLDQRSSNNSSPSTPFVNKKPRGRGQMLKILTEQRSRLDNTVSYDFPPDDELLNLPQVTPQIKGVLVDGKEVSVLRKFNKD